MPRRPERREAESLVSALVVFVVIGAAAIEAPRQAALTPERAAAALSLLPRLVAAQAACGGERLCIRI